MNRPIRSPIQAAVFLGLILLTPRAHAAGEVLFQSSPKQTTLIELFTAEGCSTCPPAEEWLGNLKADPGLWKEIIPIAFHVDYWDRRGWKDRFATPAFTQRQRAYASTWGTGSAYTPAFAVNGKEWRGAGKSLPIAGGRNAGVLKIAQTGGGRLAVTYLPSTPGGEWDVHVALLGSGLVSKIGGGENAGRQLHHDFTALSYNRAVLQNEADGARADVTVPRDKSSGRTALAAWVTKRDQLLPIQSTGGWLP